MLGTPSKIVFSQFFAIALIKEKSSTFDNSATSSDKFLEECTYSIDLRQLYTVKSTCYFHEGMKYCPVLLMILRDIQKFYEGKAPYLLQVWSKEGKKVYEKNLKKEVTAWNIFYQYFIYKPQDPDQNHGFYHLVNLEKGNATYLIKDFIQDPDFKYLAYHADVFYVASSTKLKLFYLEDKLSEQDAVEPHIVEVPQEELITMEPEGHKIHGFYINFYSTRENNSLILALETIDNQIDFNTIYITKKTPAKEFEYKLRQLRQIFPRQINFDPVVNFQAIFQANEMNYAAAMRQSGQFDLYYNSSLVWSSGTTIIQDFEMSFDTIYLQEDRYTCKRIEMTNQDRISMECAVSAPKENLLTVFYQRIKNQCKIFYDFCFINNFVLIAHGRIISQKNILRQNKWINHIVFHCDVEAIFRLQGEIHPEVYVLLKDGSIQKLKVLIVTEDSTQEDNPMNQPPGTEVCLLNKDVVFKINDDQNLVQFKFDKENGKWAILTVLNEDKSVSVYTLNGKGLINITSQLPKFTSDHNVIFLSSNYKNSLFILQNKNQIELYEIDVNAEGNPSINLMIDTVIIQSLKENLNSGLILKSQKHMLLMDRVNIYKVQCQTKQVTTYQHMRCQGMYFSDEQYMYTLQHKSEHGASGLRLYDIENVIEKDQDTSFFLTSVQVGVQSHIDFSIANQRILFQKSFDSLEILPLLHRNTINFVGMQTRDKYLATKVIQNQFIALNTNNNLVTWDIMTGKWVMQWNLEDNENSSNYSNFQVYQMNQTDLTYQKPYSTKVLLRSKTPIENYDDFQFFDPTKNKAYVENQVSYIKKIAKAFYEFKLIEIQDSREVKEYFSFIHPYYNGTWQLINFSENGEYMYEQLVVFRIFIYKKVLTNDGNKVSWQIVHKFTSFPNDLVSTTFNPLIFTPDFTKYIDLDRPAKQFVIKDSFTQNVIQRIPEDIMNCNKEEVQNVIRRFAWIDNERMRVISHDGIERIIDATLNFRVDSFNVIQMYNPQQCNSYNIIFDQPSPGREDTLNRLIMKYQKYRSSYYLLRHRTESELKSALFTVDYGINQNKGQFVADLSFTFLHWKMMQQLAEVKLKVEELGEDQVQLMIYNILPGGDTALHILKDRGGFIEKIFQNCQPKSDDRSFIKYHIPFIHNMDQKSPMDLVARQSDFKTMNVMLDYLQGYGIDHHSRAIQDQYSVMVGASLPCLSDYLDSRLQETEQTKTIRRGNINEDKKGVVAASYILNPYDLNHLLVEKETDIEIKLQYIDIPKLHSYTDDQAQSFFEELADTDNLELFQKRAIKKLIEFKWPLVREYTIKKLFLPFIAFIVLYVFYTNFIYYQRLGIVNSETKEISFEYLMKTLNYIFLAILTLLSCYFLQNEYIQLEADGINYLLSAWNYLDLITPVFTIIFAVLAALGEFDNKNRALEGSIQATVVLFMWLKFLYFLRIFEKTGYLIRIIIDVIQDMRYFLAILLLTIVAFGDAMYQISSSNEQGDSFIQGGFLQGILYIYEMILGNFSTEFGQVAVPYAYILFLLCTVLNMIIMMNLLIAIISQSFEKISSMAVEASYQERASIIAENSYLIPNERKLQFCANNTYLLLASAVEEDLSNYDPFMRALIDLKGNLLERVNKVEQDIKSQIETNNEVLMEKIKEENKLLLELIKKAHKQE